MKENLTIRECKEIKETLLETLEALDDLITIKELIETYNYESTSEIFVYNRLLVFLSSFSELNSYDYIYKEGDQ